MASQERALENGKEGEEGEEVMEGQHILPGTKQHKIG